MRVRRLDDRGYAQPFPEPLRTRLVTAWVLAAAAGGTLLAAGIALGDGGSFSWWLLPVIVGLSLVPGSLAGVSFASRDREVAVPTPVAAGVAAFLVAVGTPFVVLGLVLLVALMTGHGGE